MNDKSLIKKFYIVMFIAVLSVPVIFILTNYSMLLIYTLISAFLDKEEPFNSSFLYANLYLIFFIALSILVILGAQYFKRTINRVNIIQKTVKQIAYDESVPEKLDVKHDSKDEINHLAQSINILIDRLRYKESILDKQEKQKREYLKQLTHDINTPLQALNIEMYQVSKYNDINDKDFESLYNKVDYVSRLVGKIALTNQADIDNYYLFKDNVDIKSLIDRTLMKWRYLFDKNDIVVKINVAGEIMWYGDALWLERLFDNIISNVYSHSGTGRIEITMDERVIIRDYGSGFKQKKSYPPDSGNSIIETICRRFDIDLVIISNSEGTEYSMEQKGIL